MRIESATSVGGLIALLLHSSTSALQRTKKVIRYKALIILPIDYTGLYI